MCELMTDALRAELWGLGYLHAERAQMTRGLCTASHEVGNASKFDDVDFCRLQS
jgi:hypothetical protein